MTSTSNEVLAAGSRFARVRRDSRGSSAAALVVLITVVVIIAVVVVVFVGVPNAVYGCSVEGHARGATTSNTVVPVGGATVKLLDVRTVPAKTLGSTTTSADGSYRMAGPCGAGPFQLSVVGPRGWSNAVSDLFKFPPSGSIVRDFAFTQLP